MSTSKSSIIFMGFVIVFLQSNNKGMAEKTKKGHAKLPLPMLFK